MMTNDELKKKICDIIAPYVSAYGEDEAIADALIAAGIGDINTVRDMGAKATAMAVLEAAKAVLEAAKAEHRAEVAERALGNLAYKIAVVKFGDMSTVAMEKVKNAALEQAEKELAEERKDGKMR